MALDSSAKKSNFYFSLKKYIIDNLAIAEGLHVIFDAFLPPEKNVSRWISVIQGQLDRNTLSNYDFQIYCVTRQDYEGDQLATLCDLVVGYFLGDLTKNDTLIRIPFYDSVTKVQNGSMIITKCEESELADAPDQSKFLVLSITAKMASII